MSDNFPSHDVRGNPLVRNGVCPVCSAPEERGGQRVGMYVSFICGSVARSTSWGRGLVAYDMSEIRLGEDCKHGDNDA